MSSSLTCRLWLGLTDDVLDAAEQLNAGFGSAMVVAAVLVGSGGLISALGLRRAHPTEVD